jgi:predicted nuclease of predicted toxin-antitoxin system
VRWLADECVHAPVVASLRSDGHDVLYAAEILRQSADINLAQEALRTDRILLTEDKDFGELTFRERQTVPGILLLRFPTARRHLKWSQLQVAIRRYGGLLQRSFTVVEENRIRSRLLVGDDKPG